MKKTLILAATLALAGHAATALAAPATSTSAAPAPSPLTPEHFAQLDKDGSGGISKAEYEQFMRDAFKKLDKDGSNTLSRAETADVLTPEQFAATDKDKNGELTLDEVIAQAMRDFDRHDSNKDGILQP